MTMSFARRLGQHAGIIALAAALMATFVAEGLGCNRKCQCDLCHIDKCCHG
jgi:hypothetical protein